MEPLTLTAVSAMVLSEGIKFLYGQAGELLKRRRERHDRENAGEAQQPTESVPLTVQVPAILEGQFNTPIVHYDRLDETQEQLRTLRQSLNDYVDGIEEVDVDPTNHDLLKRVDALRLLLEVVYGQRITFKGESRPPSGTPVVMGTVEVGSLVGEAAGLAAGTISSGEAHGVLKVDRIEAGGKGYGVNVDRIGD